MATISTPALPQPDRFMEVTKKSNKKAIIAVKIRNFSMVILIFMLLTQFPY